VLLLPYYIAAQNIEHEFFERTGEYHPFEGICFADTLDMGAHRQLNIFAPENTERIHRQEAAPIFVILGNPPYNVGQSNENDNNKNRLYPGVDERIRQTYVKSSQATLKMQLYDMYVRFFRWATDRLGNGDGVVCFVSNNSFLDQFSFDGMRKELLKDFTRIYTLDLGGNVRKNPKLSGTTHNVFGIQVGVAITLLIRHRGGELPTGPARVFYARVGEEWRKEEKYRFLDETGDLMHLEWQELIPDARGAWLTAGFAEEFETFLPMGSKEFKLGTAGATDTVFETYSGGIKTNRDNWVYDFDRSTLIERVKQLIETYNNEVDRWHRRSDKSIDIDDFLISDDNAIKWSGDLKVHLKRRKYAEFSEDKIRHSLYRPFTPQYLYFDPILNNSRYLQHLFFPTVTSERENRAICLTDVASEKPFMVLMSNKLVDLHLVGAGAATQCFPFYTYDESGGSRRENITDWALQRFQGEYGAQVSKWDIFHYLYGLLHAPDYRRRYAENLKRDLPHIPLLPAEDFHALTEAGRALAALHLDYENAPEYRLRHIERRDLPWSWRVETMTLSRDKTQLKVNEVLTLDGIPPEVYEYQLGNRSALEWIIDRYRVRRDARSGISSDPNDPADPEAIVRLVKQIITVSLETARIVRGLPGLPGG
ncbi:MAG: DNA helicase, partial [Ardenticatenales bacterium]|nr:DNA helicase [Ardenticatenales bacterium]